MTNQVTYKLAQIFNYDSTSNEIIETRSVKRNIKENPDDDFIDIQVLKARTKRHHTLDIPKSLNDEVEKDGMISYNVDVTKEQVEGFMNKTFDLFKLDLNMLNTENSI